MLGYMGNKIKTMSGVNTAIKHKSTEFFCKRPKNKYFRLCALYVSVTTVNFAFVAEAAVG